MCVNYFQQLNLCQTKKSGAPLSSGSSAASVCRFEDHSWRSETGVRTYSKKLRSASNVVIVIMQSGILPGNWHKFSGLGIYQSILNPAVLQICKIESEKIQQKSRSFWNEVSSNNAKSPFPGQLVESFRLGNISIYLKPWSSTNVKNWIFFHDPRFLYRFYPCVYSL